MKFLAGAIERPAFAAALFLAGYLCLFQPALVYDGNERLFHYGLAQLGLLLLPAFALLLGAFVLLASIGPPAWRRAFATALCGAAFAAWVGGTFFTPSKGLLDGRALLQLGDARATGINAVLYLAAFAAACALATWRPQWLRRFLLVLFALLALQGAWITVHDAKPWRHSPDVARLGSMSPQRNVLVVLLDGFQSDLFADIVAREPALGEGFEGFTYFPNAVAHAPTTYLSMPGIHTGVPPAGGEHLRALYQQSVVHDSFMAKLAARGYDAVLVNPILQACPQGAECYMPDDVVHGERVLFTEYAVMLLNFSAFRTVPAFARGWIYQDGRWLTPWRLWERQAQTANALLDRFGREARADNPRPTVRFLHLFSTHAPAHLAADCRPLAIQPWTRANVEAQAHCAVGAVSRLLASMRARNLYDNTAIVVLADHGAGLPLADGTDFSLGTSASPLLLVKPLAARGPLATSRRVVGLVDVAATVCAQAGACSALGGHDVFGPDAYRTAYEFLDYQWDPAFFESDEVTISNRFEVEGPPWQVDSWWRKTNLPDTAVSALSFGPDDPASALGLGWGPVEHAGDDDGRWAVGTESGVYLRLPEAGPASLRLDVFTHGGNPGQRMEVLVNGRSAASFPVSVERVVHDVSLADGLLLPGTNRIVFRFHSANPGTPQDARRLAVFFHDLSVNVSRRP